MPHRVGWIIQPCSNGNDLAANQAQPFLSVSLNGMPTPPSDDDRPDPNENMPAVRARVPEHVARGEISTGVIVVTGGTEYVLDFVRNLPRPNAIVARVVLPHMVMPQFIEALSTNIELYRQRYGDLPGAPQPIAMPTVESHIIHAGTNIPIQPPTKPVGEPGEPVAGQTQEVPSPSSGLHDGTPSEGAPLSPAQAPGSPTPAATKRQNPQDIYDELKIRDEILSGAYANAVMIGHGPYEFSFDFITNFYPQSAVSCRVYLAAGHIWRLLDSLKQSWEQLRPRLGLPGPPGAPGSGAPGSGPGPSGPLR